MNKKLVLGVISAITIAGLGVAATIPAFAATSSTTAATQQAVNSHNGHTHNFQNHKGQKRGGGELADISKILGIDAKTLLSDLKSGQSIAYVAQSKGISEQTLISDLQSQLKSRLDQAVQNGKLTQEKEQQMLTNATAKIQKFIERKGLFAKKGGFEKFGRKGGQFNQIAKVLGIDAQTLKNDLKAGQSIADIAQSKGISEQTLISDLQSQLKSRLDQAVQNGKLTQDKEQQMLTNASAKIQKFIEQKGAFEKKQATEQQATEQQVTE